MKPVILTGLRANNDLHIGNYLGAIKPMVEMALSRAGEFQVNMFVPDLHSFTTPIDHSTLQQAVLSNVKVYAAAGLPMDNPDVHVYRQSYISAHSELTWILDCFTGMGEMNRMTQFKDKSNALNEDRISVGLFNYPVLMAADILLYRASYVPVGDDQSQHVEFARDIAQRMNKQFNDVFVVPKSVKEQHQFFGKDQGLRIKDLQNPTKKMSKSDESGKGVLFLSDSPEIARKKVMSAITDDHATIAYDPNKQPGISNLLELLSIVSGTSIAEVVSKYEGQSMYGPLKSDVADHVCAFLTNFQSSMANLDDASLLAKLEASELAMREQADNTLLQVQKAIGLRS